MTKLTVKILIGVLLSYVFLVSSCYKKKGIISSFSSSLSEAELLILTYPDSALSLLENLNPNNEDISLKARYALLLTQAEDKNYILHTDDSLINMAVSYYDSVRNVEQAFVSFSLFRGFLSGWDWRKGEEWSLPDHARR